jgi:hypothetical protein
MLFNREQLLYLFNVQTMVDEAPETPQGLYITVNLHDDSGDVIGKWTDESGEWAFEPVAP